MTPKKAPGAGGTARGADRKQEEAEYLPTPSEVQATIAAAVADFPNLTPGGLGGPPSSGDADEIVRAYNFLGQCEKVSVLTFSSYTLKHLAEQHAADRYVSNGALIVAAHALGFKIESPTRSLNPLIGVSRKSISRLAASAPKPSSSRLVGELCVRRRRP